MRGDGAVEALSSENGVGVLGSDIGGSCGSGRGEGLVGFSLRANSWEQEGVDKMGDIVSLP